MRQFILVFALAASLPVVAMAEEPKAAAPAPATGHYSTATTDIGVLMDDPAAKAVLDKAIPGMTSNPQANMMRGMTLASLQQYVPDQITAAKLAEIDKQFQALPAKK
jgi:hypothetical protein